MSAECDTGGFGITFNVIGDVGEGGDGEGDLSIADGENFRNGLAAEGYREGVGLGVGGEGLVDGEAGAG